MFKDKLDSFKALIVKKNDNQPQKKKIENMVVFLVLLIITIIAIKVIWTDNSTKTNPENNVTPEYKQLALEASQNSSNISTNDTYNLEEELEGILSKISGVGQVKVLITYSETSEVVPMYNETHRESTTQESDTNGGVRTIQETDRSKEIIYEENSGEKVPITQKVVLPKIEGALVIAEGASNTSTKVNIIQAVEAVTGLATHKIQVFEMGK